MADPNDRTDPLQPPSTNLPETAQWQASEPESSQTGGDTTRQHPEAAQQDAGGHPDRIGRYRNERVLGKGAFGTVYQGYDDELKRPVAIKVPHRHLVNSPEDIELYLKEAQVVACLDHANIVPVHDVGRTEDGLCYVVSKFIEGTNLAVRIKNNPLSHCQAAELVATIAEALHHAHLHRVVHRDIKPSNILLDSSGKPYVADFGLALKEEDFGEGSGGGGTPAYMSPEQARGEGHLVDGRADIFSLGVVFYELLTATRPFSGANREETIELIRSLEARPPRQLDDSIPNELERICLKALSKRARDRYTTAIDMAKDLRHFLAQTAEVGQPVDAGKVEVQLVAPAAVTPSPAGLDSGKPLKIVPKGLRSFDAQDADFFLELLPGPRDRDGLPESIRFWKYRVEETNSDKTFRVGLIYGPSGCGKSSLVKAGLLPRLAAHVVLVFIEATADNTEARLLRGLRKQCPGLHGNLGLKDSIAALRRGRGIPAGKKVLIVLDQFEQWLHAQRDQGQSQLVEAVRQCDGERVQCIVMVRDDFWMAVTRFMQELEVELVEGQNSIAVDLFDIDHAKRVLAAFGRAFGKLPEKRAETGKEQTVFLEQAATGLAEEGKVVCVRLALFSEMMKGKPWTPSTLKAVGGTEGVGVTFLEETFSAATAPPEHRLHQKAARLLLKTLLPEPGMEIRGQMRSHQELLESSGYAGCPKDFVDLLRILDGELRLVTPTDPKGLDSEDGRQAAAEGKYYQLTHDYLVPSLRDWLTRKQKETRRGRAELRLAERSALWNAKAENRQLPAWWEFLNVRLLVNKNNWTDPQRRMMRKAGRYHGLRGLALAASLVVLAMTGLTIRSQVIEHTKASHATSLVQRLLDADIAQVLGVIDEMEDYRTWTDPMLEEEYEKAPKTSARKLHASLALLPGNAGKKDYLYERLLDAKPQEVPVIRDALAPHKDALTDKLWAVVERPAQGKESERLRAACALATFDPNSQRWEKASGPLVDQIVAEHPLVLGIWIEGFRPIRGSLLGPLAKVLRDSTRAEKERLVATNVLADYAADQASKLADPVLDANEKQFAVLFPKLKGHGESGARLPLAEIDKRLEPTWADPPLNPAWQKPDAALVQKIESAEGIVAERFAFCQTMALGEFVEVAERLRKSGYRPIRFRPCAVATVPSGAVRRVQRAEVLVAGVWTRDGLDWQLAHGLSADTMRKQDDQLRTTGYCAIDVAGYLVEANGTPTERYCGLWAKRMVGNEDSRLYVGATEDNRKSVEDALEKAGFRFQRALQVFQGLDGQNRLCGVRLKAGGTWDCSWNQTESEFEANVTFHGLLRDIHVGDASPTLTTTERCEQQAAEAEVALKSQPDDPKARLARASANAVLGRDDKAMPDLSLLCESDSQCLSALRLRAKILLLKGENESAYKAIERLRQLPVGRFEAKVWEYLADTQAEDKAILGNLARLPEYSDQAPFDLLRLVDPDREYATGHWEVDSEALISPVGLGCRIEIPYVLPDEYTVRATVTPEKLPSDKEPHAFIVGLSTQGRRFQVTLDFENKSAIENVDGNRIGNLTTHTGSVLKDGKTSVIEYHVTPGSVRVICDGKEIIRWAGQSSSLSLDKYWRTPSEKVLFLGAYLKRHRIHSVVIDSHGDRPDGPAFISAQRFSCAKAYAMAAQILRARGRLALADDCLRECTKILREMLVEDHRQFVRFQREPLIEPLLSDSTIERMVVDQLTRYTAVWGTSAKYESQELHGLSPERHLEGCRKLISLGYRPMAISVAAIGQGRQRLSASVWHRPVVSENDKENLAKRQANAAVALLRMARPEKVWPLLKHSPDPTVRSYLIHRLGPMGADPRAIVRRLEEEPDLTIRRALLLSLGEFGDQAFAPGERELLMQRLRQLYRNDPDPGLHAAAEWVLRTWKQDQWLRQTEQEWAKNKQRREQRFQSIRQELAQKKGEARPQWYVTGEGQTMVVIPGLVEFLMGSPTSEPWRCDDESLHRERIGHTFAIAAKAVTVDQYVRFRRDHSYTRQYAPVGDCPVHGMSWYEAAEYCNWLSEQEGLPQQEWCYERNKDGRYDAGMKPAPDYLKRTGYRLPTESEWEYACRAGAVTSRYYGQSEELLGKYCWYTKNSGDRSWPVGSLKPNDFGLFDMHGNVWAWCHDSNRSYKAGQGGKAAEDREDNSVVTDATSRVLRGGGFNYPPWYLRSAFRGWNAPESRDIFNGFRPARTYN